MTNYAFPVTAVIAKFHEFLFTRLAEFSSLLKNKRIVVFGAGTRGSEMLFVLKSMGFSEIVFCDNNEEKQQGYIDDYPIYSLSSALEYTKPQMFLVPIENGREVCRQLTDKGLKENIDFLDLSFDLYDEYMKEFVRHTENNVVIFGDCAFSHISIYDEQKRSLADMVKEKYGERFVKILVMHGMGTRSFYHILNSLLQRGEKPRSVIVEVTPMMLAPKAYIMPRTQHPELIKRIHDAVPYSGAEMDNYVAITSERFNRLQIETASSLDKNKAENISKLYMRMNYMHRINVSNERIVYLKKLIELMNSLSIPITLYIPPVNYIYGENILGEEFTSCYRQILNDLWQALGDLSYVVADASFLLNDIDFAIKENHDETANYEGRIKLLEFLSDYIEKDVSNEIKRNSVLGSCC